MWGGRSKTKACQFNINQMIVYPVRHWSKNKILKIKYFCLYVCMMTLHWSRLTCISPGWHLDDWPLFPCCRSLFLLGSLVPHKVFHPDQEPVQYDPSSSPVNNTHRKLLKDQTWTNLKHYISLRTVTLKKHNLCLDFILWTPGSTFLLKKVDFLIFWGYQHYLQSHKSGDYGGLVCNIWVGNRINKT